MSLTKRVVAIIGARLNSSRLPGKQLLELAGKPLIERLFERLECVPEIDQMVLATTADEYNNPLVQWAQENQRAVFAYEGDVNDLVGRVDAVVDQQQADIVLYICGDSPLIEPTTLSRLLSAMLTHNNADSVDLNISPSGQPSIHEGFSIFSLSYWKSIVAVSATPAEREHVGAGRSNLRQPAKILRIDEPEIFFSVNHRVSVDTPSDYQFMTMLYQRWYEHQPASSIVSLPWVVEQVQSDITLRSINCDVQQKKVGERALSVLLVTEAGSKVGLGHLKRVAVVARALQDYAKAKVKLLIVGEKRELSWLSLLPLQWLDSFQELEKCYWQHAGRYRITLFDLKERVESRRLLIALTASSDQGERLFIAVDGFVEQEQLLDLLWIPGHYLPESYRQPIYAEKLIAGWECYLIEQRGEQYQWGQQERNSVLIQIGGGDVDGIGEKLPRLLQQMLPGNSQVHWIQGPYAPPPNLDSIDRLEWIIYHSPDDLTEIYQQCDVALVGYGVSLFELLRYGMPTVVVSTSAGPGEEEWKQFKNMSVAVAAGELQEAVSELSDLMVNRDSRRALHLQALDKIDGMGAQRLANKIAQLSGQCEVDR